MGLVVLVCCGLVVTLWIWWWLLFGFVDWFWLLVLGLFGCFGLGLCFGLVVWLGVWIWGDFCVFVCLGFDLVSVLGWLFVWVLVVCLFVVVGLLFSFD